MKLVTFEDYPKEKFKEQLLIFKSSVDIIGGRSSQWFDLDHPQNIIDNIDNYTLWTLMIDDADNVLAFSAIDEKRFEESNCARVMSRTFYHPSIRRRTLRYEYDNVNAPVIQMLQYQLNFLKGTDKTIIMTMELLRHRKNLAAFFEKCNKHLNHKWKLMEGLYRVVPNYADPQSWQNLGVYGDVEKINMPRIRIKDWKIKYGMPD
jgi:hypothetical protein